MATNTIVATSGPGRPGRPKQAKLPDHHLNKTKSPEQARQENLSKRLVAAMKRKARAIAAAEIFSRLPDEARVKQPTVELLTQQSATTIWRKVKAGTFPAPRKDGYSTSWSARDVRNVLVGGA